MTRLSIETLMNSMHLPEILVIDLDDTLYLERDFVRSGFSAVEHHVHLYTGLEGFGNTCWRLFLEGVRGETFDRAASEHGWALSLLQRSELVDVYRNHEPSISLDSPTRRVLETLSSSHRLVLFTGGYAPTQKKKIDALGLTTHFSIILLTGESGLELDKPHASNWHHVELLTKRSGSDIMCIGDNPAKDIHPSLAAGWRAIRVRQPMSLHESVPTPGGAVEISHLSDLFDESTIG